MKTIKCSLNLITIKASIRVIRLGNFPPINYEKYMKCNQKVDDGKMIFV